ncbi:Platelet-activating factor acetylhydrolase [Myotis brandtii]|uniref:Platelet-activating factor acetylhydrolase n=1 Tax=Myotis brandtii TaxID=109478 RepID=S7P2R5_MYOBR|nr:Platelet-activating factor acetylhydrolase [Myotis brandtii]
MLPPKLHALFCLCSCLTLVHPLGWQDVNPVVQPEARINKIQALMAAAIMGQSEIPKGSGPYPVGCTDLMSTYTKQGTFLRLYYPAQDNDHPDTVWIPNKQYFFGLSKFLGTHWLMGNVLSLLFGSKTTPASWNAPVRTGEKYPLVVFSHGLGAFRTIYSAIGNDLASHGFIVATVEHRDGSASATYYFDDQSAAEIGKKSWLYLKTPQQGENEVLLRNSQVRQRAKECSQALDVMLSGTPVKNVLDSEFDMQRLRDSIDRDKIAVMGHSFGGATVIQALHDDRRFRGSVHQNFADFTFATGKAVGYIFTLKGKIDSEVAMDLTNKASLAFLQKHLGLQKDFDKWDYLIEGKDDHLIPGTNVDTTNYHGALQNSTSIEK